MMSLWVNLRRSLSKQSKKVIDGSSKQLDKTTKDFVADKVKEKREIFTFPYGSKECVVYKEKGKKTEGGRDPEHYSGIDPLRKEA